MRGQGVDSASVETVEGWDSTATVTLVALVEEEFGIQFEPSALERVVSFRSLLDYLEELPATSQPAAEKRC
jgi:acyl carrier protein